MKRALLLLVVALAICFGATAIAAAAPAAPYTANTDCLFCHDTSTGSGAVSRVEFDLPPAMLSRCKSCHGQRYHWNHYDTNTCGGCHPGRPAVYALYPYPKYWNLTYGAFQTEASLSKSPQEIHAIHVNGSIWQNDRDGIDGTVCGKCHKPASCASCHGSDADPATHASHTKSNASYPPVTYQQATGTMVVSTSVTCVTPACHSLSNASSANFKPFCGSCHPTRVNDHGYDVLQHTADVTSTVNGGGKTCGDCHQMALYAEHTRTSSASASRGCGACHPSPRNSFTAWDQTCQTGGCHAAASSSAPHASETASHTPLASGNAAVCLDCHAGDLAGIHSVATSTVDPTRTSCLVCHSSTSVPATKDCTTCHFAYDNHPYPTDKHLSDSTLASCGGTGCHNTRDLLGVHREKNPAYGCGDCHGSSRSEVQNAIANGLTACSDCHPGVSETQAHYAQHEARPPLLGGAPGYLPNYAFYTGSAMGGLFTGDCAGCHASNLMDAHLGGAGRAPQFDSAGAPLTCDTCHKSTDARVVAAIAAGPATGETKCDACHTNPMTGGAGVHGPINQTHTSALKTSPEVKCTPCHTDNLVDQHDGGRGWPDANGRVLVGCDVCHKNFAGTRGAEVQAAIQPLNDTKCTACHSATHPDFNSHEATTSASLACGVCHANGQTSIDVKAVHASAKIGPCAVCHDNTGRVADIRTKTAECASCHTAQGTDYHRNFENAHLAPNSQSCVDCHETNSVTALHAGVSDGCAVCHDNASRVPTLPATTACINCHSDKSPADPDHYTGTAATHTASDATQYGYACSVCHKLEMKPEHVKASSGAVSCVQCHEQKVDNLGGAWNKTCAACHGAQHAAYDSAHVSTQGACAGSNCHDITNLRTLHSNASTTTASGTFADCRVCHQNSDALPATTDCYGCHAGHGDLTTAHTATTSGDCTSCHETGDVRTLHAGSPKGACDVCHDNPAVATLPAKPECVNCHSDESPADPDHYTGTETAHTATNGTESGFACSQCHKIEMKPEHDKASSGAVSCVTCHETKVDTFTSAWNKTCAACHASKHGGISTAHNATGFGNANDCGGAGCHEITDLRAIHANSITGNAVTMGDASCATANCHTSDTTIPSKKSCDSVGCHAGTQPHKHELNQAGSVYLSDATGGCTSAGAGCHGVASDPSYATYHPNSGCTTGACHTAANHSAAQFNDPNTCQNCHGGGATLYDGAANVSSLLGSSPSGHYVDAKHTPAVNNTGMIGATGGTVIGYCRDCHNPASATGPDGLYVQHSGIAAWNGKVCSECHNDSAAVTAVVKSNWTSGLCSDCHKSSVLSSASQHSTASAPAVTATEAQGSGSCVTSGCHATLDLHVLHKGSASTPATSELRTQGCAAGDCHDYSKQAAKPTKKSCGAGGGCHTTEPHNPAAHNSTLSSECLACHQTSNSTADIRYVVSSTGAVSHAGCSTCHNSGANLGATNQAECVECHNATEVGTHAYTPADPNHYNETTHTAASMTRAVSAGGTASATCQTCHSTTLKAAHAGPTPNYGTGLSCTECHNDTLSFGKAQAAANWSNNLCDDCHKTGASAVMHSATTAPLVTASTTAGCTTGTGCHATELHTLHKSATTCALSGCHDAPNVKPSKKSCGTGGTCHTTLTGDHEAQHDTAGVIDSGCYGCHFQYLTTEHMKLGLTCATCHQSTNAVVTAAIAAHDRDCMTCHPDSPHNARQTNEFSAGNASMHRVRADLPGMRSSFVVNGSTYSWSLPTAASFLKSGYTTNSIVTCNMCHTYSGTTGPHGATMKVNIDPAYPNSYNTVGGSSSTAQLSPSSPSGMSMSGGSTAAKIICEKCHDLNGSGSSFSNIVHNEHGDRGSQGGYCVHCHASTPHGMGRPRLLAYTTDAAPYRTTTGGIERISLKSYTPSGWNKADCGAGCSSDRHPLTGSKWPNVMAGVLGNLAGKVTSTSGGAAVSGATVSLGNVRSTTTAADGTYSLAGVPAGVYPITVSKTGFTTWTGSATVVGDVTGTLNISLAPLPGVVSGSVTDADSGVGVTGVTVQVTGDGSTTSSGSGLYSLTLAPGTYTLTYSLNGYATQTKSVTITSNTTTTQNVTLAKLPTNWALNQTVTQSSQYTSTYSGAKAVDGDSTTYWRPSGTGTQWIIVDLGATRSIKKFVLDWSGSYYATSYRIETASSATGPWTQQFSQSNSYTGDRTISLSGAVSARYVRVYCTSTSQTSYRLSEFQVLDR